MALKIENEVQWLTDLILHKILHTGRLVDNYDKSQAHTFLIDAIGIELIGAEEAFMLTLCYRATVKFSYNGEKHQRKLIVKVIYYIHLYIVVKSLVQSA